jgi:hypothetical protein
VIGLVERSMGRVAHADGTLPEARHHLDRAIDVFRTIEARWELARTLLDAAVVAYGFGETTAATRHLAEAYQLFTGIGVPRYVERTADLARRLGLESMTAPVTRCPEGSGADSPP